VCLRYVIGRSHALAAGATWTNLTSGAPWAARGGHTSVVDAAGAIYVIGGQGYTHYQDVWASIDGGARPGSAKGWSGGTRRYSRGTRRVLRGYSRGYYGGTKSSSRCTEEGKAWARGILGGYSGGT
jgi:hypothetical protein